MLHARGGRRPDAVHDRVDAAALVEVRAAQEQQHPAVADLHRADLAAVPDGGRGGEPGQLADGDAAPGGAERVGGRGPAGAHHHRDVVGSAERRGEGVGGLGGEGVGVGAGSLVHAGTLTQERKTVCGARARAAQDGPVTRNDRGPQPTLTGSRVRLRPWRTDDVDAVCRRLPGRRDPALDAGPRALRAGARRGVRGRHRRRDTWAEGGALFAVEPRDGGPLVGSIGLFPPSDGFAEAGYWTAPGARGQGFTAEALGLLSGWAFDDVGVRRVELRVDPDNAGSRRVAERAGFRAEGTVRQRFLHRGQPSDVVLYALLAADPREAERQ